MLLHFKKIFLFIFTFIIFFYHGISHAALLQSTYLGGDGNETGHAIAIHPTTGDAYITGTADGHVFVSRLSGDLKTLYQTTSLGGSGWEGGYAIAIHPATGDVYVTGCTTSADFPGLTNGADTTFEGYNEAFVARLSGDLLTLHQSTFLGGNSYDASYGIAIHPATGDVYVTGVTNSVNFPNIAGGADTAISGDEAFVTRLSGDLRTIYKSTYLGGSRYDSATAIAIHPVTGKIYVTGTTGSSDFPGIAGGADATLAGDEAFVSRLSSSLQTLHQSTYLGGSGDEAGCGIAIHPTNGIYVTGHTFSNDFPGTTNGADTTFAVAEAFVARLSDNLKTLQQSTYLGGSDDDVGIGIAIDVVAGNVSVTGFTASSNFPNITNGTFAGGEGFVSRLSSNLQTLYQSTYLGGRSADTGAGIAVHPATGRIYVTGATGSSDFPSIAGGADTTFSNWTFATEVINTGTECNDTQIDLGTPGVDFILQYGLGGIDTQYISGADLEDWLVQIGGAGNDNQSITGGTGDDLSYQTGGAGNDTITSTGAGGNDWIYQDGGAGNDTLKGLGGIGNDYIYEIGGHGNDTMRVDAFEGDDVVIIDAGAGNDAITYDVSAGTDQVFIDGGTGNDTLTINAGSQDFILLNMKGEILFQQGAGGSGIWVRSAENMKVLGPDGNPLYQVTDPGDATGGPDTSYRKAGPGEAFVAVLDITIAPSLNVVWQDNTPGNYEIYVKHSEDEGATWATKRITSTKGKSQNSAIARDNSGNLFAVWQDDTSGSNKIYMGKSTDGGATWSPPQALSLKTGNARNPAIAIDNADNIYSAWQGNAPGNDEIYLAKSTDGGTQWTLQRLSEESGQSQRPAIAIDDANAVYVVWQDNAPGNDEIYLKKSKDGGGTWTQKRISFTTGQSRNPAVTTDSAGVIYVAWQDNTEGNYEIYLKKSADCGNTWTLRRISTNTGQSQRPSIAVDSTNTIYLAWQDDTPGNNEIYLKKSADGGNTWTSNRITNNAGQSQYPSVSVDYWDNVYVMWQDNTPGNNEIYMKKSTDGGATWTQQRLTRNRGSSEQPMCR